MVGRVLILSIETATGCGSVALTRGKSADGRLLAEAVAQPEITHSRRLLGSVDWVMQAAGVQWSDLDAVAVSLGPGSFTGLRIGMAAAKGIVRAAGVPFLGVPTLDALSLSCPVIDRPLWCLLDARKQEVYAACYLPAEDGRPVLSIPAAAVRPEVLAAAVEGPVILAGPGVDEYYDFFAGVRGVRLIPASLSSPLASRVGFLAADLLAAGTTMEANTVAPFYVRDSEAEINLRKKSNRK